MSTKANSHWHSPAPQKKIASGIVMYMWNKQQLVQQFVYATRHCSLCTKAKNAINAAAGQIPSTMHAKFTIVKHSPWDIFGFVLKKTSTIESREVNSQTK